jgi:hypothetical protein
MTDSPRNYQMIIGSVSMKESSLCYDSNYIKDLGIIMAAVDISEGNLPKFQPDIVVNSLEDEK